MKEREMVGERLQSNCIREGIFVSSKVWRVKKKLIVLVVILRSSKQGADAFDFL